MARVIEKPNELITKCHHCGAKIGFDKSDVVVEILWPPLDHPEQTIEEIEPIVYRELTCPYCKRIIYLEKDYDKEVFFNEESNCSNTGLDYDICVNSMRQPESFMG